MKFIKNLSLAIALCISIIAPVNNSKADNVDAKKARQVGAYFMATQFGNKDISSDNLDQVFTLQNMVNNIPALYVFNTADKRGFVIVAGSDCVTPIVAYSTDGAFDPNNIPPNMLWWLNGEAADIVFAQNNELDLSKTHSLPRYILIPLTTKSLSLSTLAVTTTNPGLTMLSALKCPAAPPRLTAVATQVA